jgi:hypothetical protein
MPGPDWVYTALAVTLGLLAAAFALWALFADRARGQPRCLRCRYSMAGLADPATLTCPECGHRHRRVADLFRTRRRWRLAGIALVPAIAAACAFRTPVWRTRGVWPDLPLWALNAIDDRLTPPRPRDLESELSRRLMSRQLTPTQEAEVAERLGVVRWRREWPRGTIAAARFVNLLTTRRDGNPPLRIGDNRKLGRHWGWFEELCRKGPSMIQFWHDQTVPIAGPEEAEAYIEFATEQPSGGYQFRRVPLTIRRVNRIDEVLTPVGGPTIDAVARQAIALRLVSIPEIPIPLLSLSDAAPLIPSDAAHVTFAFIADIRFDGQTVVSAKAWLRIGEDQTTNTRGFISYTGERERAMLLSSAILTDPRWRILIRGDGETALRDIDATHYWDGTLDLPLSTLLAPAAPPPGNPAPSNPPGPNP